KKVLFKLKMLAFGLIVLAIFSVAVMLLWNWLIPEIFGLPIISFWQALGLLALSRILFGGFVKGGCNKRKKIKNHLRERWQKMTPEERKACFERRNKFWGKWEEEKPPA